MPGLVWQISSADLRALDGFEGVPWSYERLTVAVEPWGGKGNRLRVELYRMHADAALGLPSRSYVMRIGGAYREIGFNPEPLYRALRESDRSSPGMRYGSAP